jgi:hypothetical protein
MVAPVFFLASTNAMKFECTAAFQQLSTELIMREPIAAPRIVGVQDGSQVPAVSLNPNGIGWHITGQMGGVWAHPIKLLNQFQFLLNGNLLPAAFISKSA